MMTFHAKIATCPSEVWKMYITSSRFFGQHGDVIQCFTDSPAIADRLTTQMRDPDLLARKEQGNLFLLQYSEVLSKNSASKARVETCKKVCCHVVRPTDSSYMRG